MSYRPQETRGTGGKKERVDKDYMVGIDFTAITSPEGCVAPTKTQTRKSWTRQMEIHLHLHTATSSEAPGSRPQLGLQLLRHNLLVLLHIAHKLGYLAVCADPKLTTPYQQLSFFFTRLEMELKVEG